MSTTRVRKLKTTLAVIGAAIGGLMVASKPLVYGYDLPWVGIVIGAAVGGVAGYWAGRCFFSSKEAK